MSPFLNDPNYDKTWQSIDDYEPAVRNMFGLKDNGMALRASGSVSF